MNDINGDEITAGSLVYYSEHNTIYKGMVLYLNGDNAKIMRIIYDWKHTPNTCTRYNNEIVLVGERIEKYEGKPLWYKAYNKELNFLLAKDVLDEAYKKIPFTKEMFNWVTENVNDSWTLSGKVSQIGFESDADAAAFKLRWF